MEDLKLTDEQLAVLSGGKLTEQYKQLLDFIIPRYVADAPHKTLDEFIAYLGAKDPGGIVEPVPPEDLKEIRDYIAHYWEK